MTSIWRFLHSENHASLSVRDTLRIVSIGQLSLHKRNIQARNERQKMMPHNNTNSQQPQIVPTSHLDTSFSRIIPTTDGPIAAVIAFHRDSAYEPMTMSPPFPSTGFDASASRLTFSPHLFTISSCDKGSPRSSSISSAAAGLYEA
jgi:hypothetical protein